MTNFKLTLAYEGTNYFGWQKTPLFPTIEEELEKAFEKIVHQKLVFQAASRTDRGVHAAHQVVSFLIEEEPKDLKKLLFGINHFLPIDIRCLSIEKSLPSFHPTLNVIHKTYSYEICNTEVQLPRHRLYSWHFHLPLQIPLMEEGAKILTGTHDFSAFCNQKKNETYDNHFRTVHKITIESLEENRILIKVVGNHFLYKMVRNLVGTLVYLGCEKLRLEDLTDILEGKDRTLAGITAPAHGLTLNDIQY